MPTNGMPIAISTLIHGTTNHGMIALSLPFRVEQAFWIWAADRVHPSHNILLNGAFM